MVIFELPVRPDPTERRSVAEDLGQQIDAAVADPDIAPLLSDFSPHQSKSDDALVIQDNVSRRDTPLLLREHHALLG